MTPESFFEAELKAAGFRAVYGFWSQVRTRKKTKKEGDAIMKILANMFPNETAGHKETPEETEILQTVDGWDS
jgi:hypothetical protein